ncbi:hypothetical protein RIA_2125 [Riemerella anatipestifer RA-GD]|uniref:hypothetical protein n=1 Tax=Riemerella anatipestifer TaxID=34085 RepID=UPI0002011085|nr:hypothetical protein [Riemerella anatipestifer]ADZ13160.1 hypothetical protein RIA_2125 [Riemerella anatipestifer RA-GD]
MEIPFYTSFKEFKDNYETDLEKWLSIYPDGSEKDYLDYVYNTYFDYAEIGVFGENADEPYFKEKNFIIKVKPEYLPKLYWRDTSYSEDGDGNIYKSLYIDDIVDIIRGRLIKYRIVNSGCDNPNEIIKTYLLDKEEEVSEYGGEDSFYIERWALKEIYRFIYKDFKTIDDAILKLKIDNIRYNNFKLSVPKIYKFISDRRKEINGVQTTDEVTPTADNKEYKPKADEATECEKITINGSIQLLGYIFTELIEKGYIEPKRKSGKTNASATAEMLLNHFNFTYNANGEQPSKEYLKKALSEQNQLSPDKATLIKIPHLKKLID